MEGAPRARLKVIDNVAGEREAWVNGCMVPQGSMEVFYVYFSLFVCLFKDTASIYFNCIGFGHNSVYLCKVHALRNLTSIDTEVRR